jgi:hypothetical protein
MLSPTEPSLQAGSNSSCSTSGEQPPSVLLNGPIAQAVVSHRARQRVEEGFRAESAITREDSGTQLDQTHDRLGLCNAPAIWGLGEKA